MAFDNNSVFYMNIPGLFRVGPDDLTQEEAAEYIKCARSCEYFLSHFYYIISLDKGKIVFPPFDYQKEMINVISNNRYSILLLGRQLGKSVTVVGVCLWELIFNKDYKIGYFAHKGDLAKEMLSKVKLAYSMLPKFLQKGVTEWNKQSITLGNGSRMIVGGTTGNSGRGESFNRLCLDEFGFVARNIQEEFFTSVMPTLTSGETTKLTILSTPNGQDKFWETYTNSVKGLNNFVNFKAIWSDNPNRTEKWKEDTIKVIGLHKFRIEHECEFEDSTATLISKELLDIAYQPMEPIYTTRLGDSPMDIYNVYEEYDINTKYFIEIDVGEGLGLDNTVINVLGKRNNKWHQCAIWTCSCMNNNRTMDWIIKIAEDYNNPPICIECNGIGKALCERLYFEREYENLITTKNNTKTHKLDVYLGSLPMGANIGIKTTNTVKLAGGDLLRHLFETHRLVIPDLNTIKEFRTFIRSGTSYAAEEGHHDDIAMTFLLFSFIEHNEMFNDILNDTEESAGEDTPPAPVNMNTFRVYTSMEDFLRN